MYKNLKSAFTLAEMLVTLTIIGVIAALTIPSLNSNVQKNETVSSLQKAHSTLSQATERMRVEYGPIGIGKNWPSTDDDIANRNQRMSTFWFGESETEKGFLDKLNYVKYSKTKTDWNTRKIKQLNKQVDNNIPGYEVYTADGMMYIFDDKIYCSNKGLSPDDRSKCLGRFVVDVNGKKGPNQYGIDIFFFALVKYKGIVPAGEYSTEDCQYGDKGITCAAKVLREGKINYSTKVPESEPAAEGEGAG